MIQSKVMAVLGIDDASSLSVTSPISEFGLDSMMSVELKNELQELVGTELSGTLLFDYPTIEAISGYFWTMSSRSPRKAKRQPARRAP